MVRVGTAAWSSANGAEIRISLWSSVCQGACGLPGITNVEQVSCQTAGVGTSWRFSGVTGPWDLPDAPTDIRHRGIGLFLKIIYRIQILKCHLDRQSGKNQAPIWGARGRRFHVLKINAEIREQPLSAGPGIRAGAGPPQLRWIDHTAGRRRGAALNRLRYAQKT